MAQSHLNIALIGSGFMARSHSLAYTVLPMLFSVERLPVLHTLADVSDELAREGAQRLGFANWSSDWRQVVANPEVDAVLIATPNNVHKDMAERAIEHGKHVYCEKPLAMNAAQAKSMVEAAERAGVCTAVGFNYRKNPSALAMKQLVDSGALGRIFHFRGGFFQDWGIDPSGPLSWRFQRRTEPACRERDRWGGREKAAARADRRDRNRSAGS